MRRAGRKKKPLTIQPIKCVVMKNMTVLQQRKRKISS